VRTVIPTADREKATVKVRISFDRLDPKILPDMGVKVAFLGGGSEGKPRGAQPPARVIVPQNAVRGDGNASYVFAVRDGKVERRAVNLGRQLGGEVEVIAGVSAGDQLVVRGPEDLRDGQRVDVHP